MVASEQWGDLLSRLESEVGEMAFDTADEIISTIPGYDHASREKVVKTAQQNLSMSTRMIMRGTEPQLDDVDHANETALDRIEEGVPLGSLLSGFRLSMRRIQRRLLDLAPEYGTPSEQLLEWSNVLWTLGDLFSTCVTAVYRDHEITRTVADSTRRSEWIGRLVVGELDEAEILRGAALYKVPTDVPVRIIVAPLDEDAGVGVEAGLRRWAEAGGARLLTTVQSRSVTGVLVGDPEGGVLPAGVPLGLGSPALLTGLHRTFAMVHRVLSTAVDLGMTGIVDQDMLSWKLAVSSSPETTDMLRERYLVPLEDSRTFGEDLVTSVKAYLEHRLNVRAAAESIPVHVNTLRYRLRRFEELTGRDLGDVDTLVEVSWILVATGADRT